MESQPNEYSSKRQMVNFLCACRMPQGLEQLYFFSGYIIGKCQIIPNKPSVEAIIGSLNNLFNIVANRLISYVNSMEAITQGIFELTAHRSGDPRTFQKIVENCANQLAINSSYLRDKWQRSQRRQQIDHESLELIRTLKLEQQKMMEMRNREIQQNQEKIRKMLEEEERSRKLKKEEIENKKVQCDICLQIIDYRDLGTLECGHIFHRKCIADHIIANINSKKIEVSCPSGCGKMLPMSDIRQFVDGEDKQKFDKFSLDLYVQRNQAETSWCPTAGCTAVFSFDEALDNYRCPACAKHYCLKCRCEYHSGQTCAEYKISKSYSEDDRKFEDFVKGAKFKQCPECKFWVERNQGCNSMTCRCGKKFCYVCGGTGTGCSSYQCKNEPKQKSS